MISGGRDLSAGIPEIFPALTGLPKEDLSFDQAAAPVDAGDGSHLVVAERLASSGLDVRKGAFRLLRRLT